MKSKASVCVTPDPYYRNGLASAKGLVIHGATVVLLGPNSKAHVEGAAAEGSGAALLQGDVTPQDISQLCEVATQRFGRVDIIITNALVTQISPGERSAQVDPNVGRAQQFIEREFASPLTLPGMAASAGMSPRNFLRRFKHCTGDSPTTYLQRIRIEMAKRKLECDTLSVDEVRYQVGYEDPRSFRRLFKRYTGLTPKEYRAKFTSTTRNRVNRHIKLGSVVVSSPKLNK